MKKSVAELRAIAVEDSKGMLDLMGIEWGTSYNRRGEEMLRFKDKEVEGLLSANEFIITTNTGYDGMAAALAGAFRYGLKREFFTVDDLPSLISKDTLPIIRDVLRDCPLEWPDGKTELAADRGINL